MKTKNKLKLAAVVSRFVRLARSVRGLGDNAIVRRHGIVWDLNLREGIDLSIYLFGRFEWPVGKALERHLRPGGTCIDIGANIGAHALPMAQAVGVKGLVLAFEPSDFAYPKLLRNLELNEELSRVVVPSQSFLSDSTRSESPDVYASWPVVRSRNEQRHLLHGGRKTSVERSCLITLDKALEDKDLTRLDLIKLDVDGNEFEVLQGARAVLDEFGPKILMEIAPYVHEEGDHSFDDLLSLLLHAGYALRDLSGKRIEMDEASIRNSVPRGEGINALAEKV
jgi:FkbM family methyltransferase